MSETVKASVVFAHGLWADGTCFSKLIPALQAEGHEVIAAQYGLNKVTEDVEAVKAAFARVSGPIVLVGHSYGGTLITAAGDDPRVSALVYIAALAPDADETSQSQINQFPATPVFSQIEVTDGRIWLKPEGVQHFCGDLSAQEQKMVYATQGVPATDLFDHKAEGTAWNSKPSYYVLAERDETVHPDLQRFVSKRMKAKVVEADSSHVPMLSQPGLVLEVIRRAIAEVEQ